MPDLSAKSTYRLRSQVSLPRILECGDVAHWWCTHISHTMATAMIHSPHAGGGLQEAPIGAVLDIKAQTDPGDLCLRDYLAHRQSGARAFLVVKGGRVIAETYPDLRPEQPHLWASCAKPTAALMIEHLIDAGLFRQKVWAHLRADGPLQVHQSPDGIALAHGVVSSRLRDMARFGMLYTPSWNKVATRRVVSGAILARIRGGLRDKAFFMNGNDGPVFVDRLGDDRIPGNARQWDCIWPDGDMCKGGLMDQGLCVSPARDLVIAYFSTTPNMQMTRYLRPIATSDLLT